MGEIINFRGAVVVKEYLKENFFLAEVTEVWIEFGVGAIVLPFEPLSKCVQPMATDPKLYGNIVALKDDRKIVGPGSVVYLEAGFKDGIQRGQVFDVVRITSIASPAFRLGNFEAIVNEVGSTFVRNQYLTDFWKELNEGTKLYDYSVGKLMIVESRPGMDLLASTGRQLRLARLIGRAMPPRFWHHPLLMKSAAQKLSKSDGDNGVRDLRAQGRSADAVLARARDALNADS